MDASNYFDALSDQKLNPKKVFETEIDKWRIKIKAGWLEQNLSINFNNICSYPPERGGIINDINLLGNDNTGERDNFSIILCKRYMQQFTAVCPQIIGCVSQGNDRQQALKNLCVALSECTNLNYEILNIKPFTAHGKVPELNLDPDDTVFTPIEMAIFLNSYFEIKDVYLTNNNIIMKHPLDTSLTFVIPLVDMNVYTQRMLYGIALTYIDNLI